MKERKRILISSPLRAKTKEQIHKNMMNARHLAEHFTNEEEKAIAVHGYLPCFLDDDIKEEGELALQFSMDVLAICEAIIVCGEHISSGMKDEIAYAEENKLAITYISNEEMEAILKNY